MNKLDMFKSEMKRGLDSYEDEGEPSFNWDIGEEKLASFERKTIALLIVTGLLILLSRFV